MKEMKSGGRVISQAQLQPLLHSLQEQIGDRDPYESTQLCAYAPLPTVESLRPSP